MHKGIFVLVFVLVLSAFGLMTTVRSTSAADPCDTSTLKGLTSDMLNISPVGIGLDNALDDFTGIYAGDFNGKIAFLIIEKVDAQAKLATANYWYDGARVPFVRFDLIMSDPIAIQPGNKSLKFSRNSDGSLKEETFFGDKSSTTLTKCPAPAQ